MFHVKQFDVVVVGGGHAGCEAALASSRMGRKTLLITMDPNKIAEMSCNPSVGGVGKGQLVKEIDALGGEMGKNADYTGIQFKRLNTRKGSAVQSSRCQSDKKAYAQRMQGVLKGQSGLEILSGEVKEIEIESGEVRGLTVQSAEGPVEISTKNVVITAGTFMRGLIHCGFSQSEGGRYGEKASVGLSTSLEKLGFQISRLKTGTPARLIKESIDWSKMEEQLGDNPPYRFSFWKTEVSLPQVSCYLVHTNEETHRVILQNLDKSPLYSGNIKGVGPRYCPSIEDKVVKFPDKSRHQLFFEPEALDSNWIYPNGISTSLPAEVQDAFIRTIPGCQDVEFARYGYAVEYDCIDPRQLKPSLESKILGGLFLAGQTNGTSGYEEAAAQGLMGGINAALRSAGKEPLILSRAESYIGVMIDDLTSLGVNEPYRMFTSRAEFRTLLRQDNADERLTAKSHAIGLASDERLFHVEQKLRGKASIIKWIDNHSVAPDQINETLKNRHSAPITQKLKLSSILGRPELSLFDFTPLFPIITEMANSFGVSGNQILEQVEIEAKYSGYLTKEREMAEKMLRLEHIKIPAGYDFNAMTNLSIESRQKLTAIRPETLGQASRISGVNPADIAVLLVKLGR